MSQRQKQHMGRSEEDESRVVGRDVREGDELAKDADRASADSGNRDSANADSGLPSPSEEGRARGLQENERTDAPPESGRRGTP